MAERPVGAPAACRSCSVSSPSASAVEPNRRAIYLLLSPLGTRLAGNLSGWPDGEPTPTATSSFRSTCTKAAPGRPSPTPPRPRCSPIDAGYLLLVGRDVHDLAQSEQQIKTAIFLGIGAIVVLGLLGGLILSRWMLTRLERINRSTARIMAGEFGRRIAHRRERRRVRRSGPEPQRHARPDRAAAGRHAPGQRGHRPRSAYTLEPHALADRGRSDGRAGHRGGARAARGHPAGRRRPDRDLQRAARDRARRGRVRSTATGSGWIWRSWRATWPSSTSRWPRRPRSP